MTQAQAIEKYSWICLMKGLDHMERGMVFLAIMEGGNE